MGKKKIVVLAVVVIVIAAAVVYFFSKKGPAGKNEQLRRESVEKELTLTFVVPEVTDVIAKFKNFPGVTNEEIASYRDGIKKLMEAAPILKLLYQKQIGAGPDDRIEAATADDRELIDRYGHPWCLANTAPICVAIPSMPKRTSGVVPDEVSCDKANVVGGPFEVVVQDGGKLKAAPYAKIWPEEHGKVASILKESAAIFEKIPREAKLAAYLKNLTGAFESQEPYPYAASDVSWADFLASDSLMFVRIGADEVGGDGVGDNCESKARFHFNLGLRSQSVRDIIERLRPSIDLFENKIAALIGDSKNYTARQVQVQLPTFLDVIYANGDDVGGPSGTPIGQTLPNWCGKDGKGECMRGTMIYANKTVKAYSDKIMKEYIMPLFDPSLVQYFNAMAGLDSVVYHEMFHNLGPRESTKKPGSNATYGQYMTTKTGESWKLPIEEMKAQTGSLYMATEYYKDAAQRHAGGQMDDAAFAAETKRYREHIVYDVAWAFRMILRASRSGPEFKSRSPYSRLAAVQIGFLAEQGALKFNNETKQWLIDFDRMPEAITAMMKKVGQLYVASDVNAVEKTFLYYMKGDGEKLLHRDHLVEVAGKMPSVLFDYQLKGL